MWKSLNRHGHFSAVVNKHGLRDEDVALWGQGAKVSAGRTVGVVRLKKKVQIHTQRQRTEIEGV